MLRQDRPACLSTHKGTAHRRNHMKVIKINKTFPTLEACNAWESENIVNNRYQGRVVLSVMHESSISSPEVTITEIWCF